MIQRILPIALAILAFLQTARTTSAQGNFAIDAYSITGGGGTSSGGNFVVSGGIGLPDAGSMSGGNFAINGGFWSLAVVVQTPGSPPLNLNYSAGVITLSWPAGISGFRLESSPVVGPGASWSTVNGVVNNSINIPVTPGNLYYRLVSP